MSRYFVRCVSCLQIAAIDSTPAAEMVCGLCSGRIESMGCVHRGYLVTRIETRAACDGRCTGATGPSCDCQCGGVNHGTNRVVKVEHTAAIPRLCMPDTAEARARAGEWSATLASVKSDADYQALCVGTWLPRDRWERARRIDETIRAARKLRTHKGRMAALERAKAIR